MSSVVLDKVTKVYPGDYLAVDRLSLHADDGEFLVLLGPSGCGKSTLLRMIAGLEEITEGDLWLDGEMANHLPPRDRDVAMVFQNGALYPHRTVRGNIAFPLEIAKSDPALVQERVTELSKALHIDETLDRKPGTLSGGQRQRVAMGRAIVRQPKLFLMDEPLSNLDAGMRTELRMEISALVRSLGVTTIYVTHDQVEALTLADRIAILNRGVLQDVGTPAQIYNDPATAFVAAFLNSQQLNLLAAGVRTPRTSTCNSTSDRTGSRCRGAIPGRTPSRSTRAGRCWWGCGRTGWPRCRSRTKGPRSTGACGRWSITGTSGWRTWNAGCRPYRCPSRRTRAVARAATTAAGTGRAGSPGWCAGCSHRRWSTRSRSRSARTRTAASTAAPT
ncbi:ABC transporter ATP-binding protein [Nonomuraea antimicrobica]